MPLHYIDNNRLGTDGKISTRDGREIIISGKSKNFASSALWQPSAPGSNTNAKALYGTDFNVNGDGNFRELRPDPWGSPALVWVSKNNDAQYDADGGWNKTVYGINPTRKHLSFVYFRRVSNGISGAIYHGCHSNTENLNGSVNGNPYFYYVNIASLELNGWYLSFAIIHESGYSGGYSGLSGLYRISDGTKLLASTEYRQRATITYQAHRSYLYYSTDPLTEIEWWGPGFYEMDGTEPTLEQLLTSSPS